MVVQEQGNPHLRQARLLALFQFSEHTRQSATWNPLGQWHRAIS